MNEQGPGSETDEKLEDDVDALFKVSLTEFIGARNDLAARLKRAGRTSDANLVKALAKPTVSSWAVNQLYWKHRDAFDRLLVTSQRFRQVQTGHTAVKGADLRESLEARRESLTRLSELAAALLRDAGHNPALDTLHRVTTTLEAISASSASDGPTPGRLTQDIQPPGFESLASLGSGIDATKLSDPQSKSTPAKETRSADARPPQTPSPAVEIEDARQRQEAHRARIAAAKLSLKEAKRSVTVAQTRAERLVAQQKKAHAEAKDAEAAARQAEKQLHQAEERFKKASAASEDATLRAQQIESETEEAARALKEAELTLEQASEELESLVQESKAT